MIASGAAADLDMESFYVTNAAGQAAQTEKSAMKMSAGKVLAKFVQTINARLQVLAKDTCFLKQ